MSGLNENAVIKKMAWDSSRVATPEVETKGR